MRAKPPTTHLLWRERPFPKWDCRAFNSRPLRERAQATTARPRLLACSSPPIPLAIRSSQRRPPIQHHVSVRGRNVEARAFQLNSSRCEHEAYSHFWLSCVRAAQHASSRQENTKVVASSVIRTQLRNISNACKERLSHSQLKYWVCLTSVSLSLR